MRPFLANVINTAVEESMLLPLGAVVGLVWANASQGTYVTAVDALHFAVNDVGMVFFFALAMKEVAEATSPGGALASPRQAPCRSWRLLAG
jgi:hypothetical protein